MLDRHGCLLRVQRSIDQAEKILGSVEEIRDFVLEYYRHSPETEIDEVFTPLFALAGSSELAALREEHRRIREGEAWPEEDDPSKPRLKSTFAWLYSLVAKTNG